MRKIDLGSPPPTNDSEAWMQWVQQSLWAIESASFEETEEIADDFTMTNVTTTRTIDPPTITLQNLANVVGTLLQSLKTRGDRST